MTSPVPTSPVPTAASVAPTYRIEWLTLPGAGEGRDELGRTWHLTSEKGWDQGAAPRTSRDARATQHGSFRSRAYTGELVLAVAGTVHFRDPSLMERTKADLRALCRDGGRLYSVRRTAGAWDQVRAVELDGAHDIAPVGGFDIDFQLSFAAPDPRAHDWSWQERLATPPASTGQAGLDFTDGLDFSGAGLDFGGAPDPPAVAELGNYGTAPAALHLELTGPAPTPTIRGEVGGWQITYNGTVEDGEQLVINLDDVDARGALGRSVVSTRRGNVRRDCTPLPPDPAVAPGGVERVSLRVAGSTSARLMARLRSAWW